MLSLIYLTVLFLSISGFFGLVAHKTEDEILCVLSSLVSAGFFIGFSISAYQIAEQLDKIMGWML